MSEPRYWICQLCGENVSASSPRCRGTWLPRDVPVATALVNGAPLTSVDLVALRACDALGRAIDRVDQWPAIAQWSVLVVVMAAACLLWLAW